MIKNFNVHSEQIKSLYFLLKDENDASHEDGNGQKGKLLPLGLAIVPDREKECIGELKLLTLV